MTHSGTQSNKNKRTKLYIIGAIIYFSYNLMFSYSLTYPFDICYEDFLDLTLFKPIIMNPLKLILIREELKEYSDYGKQKLRLPSQYHEYLKSECKIAEWALKHGFEIEGINEDDDEIFILISIYSKSRHRLLVIDKDTEKIILIRLG